MSRFTLFYDNTPFSQWHPSCFEVDRITFTHAEQYMMYGKAKLFDDHATAAAILMAAHPSEQKRLGQQVKNFHEHIWVQERERIVKAGNRAKFKQNPDMLAALLATDGTVLVEASPTDRIWGIGLAVDDPRALDQTQWLGLNLLGFALTDLRAELSS